MDSDNTKPPDIRHVNISLCFKELFSADCVYVRVWRHSHYDPTKQYDPPTTMTAFYLDKKTYQNNLKKELRMMCKEIMKEIDEYYEKKRGADKP